jgi:SAM-dependent methyltransferase
MDNLKNSKIFKNKNYLRKLYSLDRRPQTSYPSKLCDFLVKRFYKTKGKLLDIGCGRGDMLKSFHSKGFDVVGHDISPLSEELCSPLKILNSDLLNEQIPLNENSMDFIFSKSVIEHLSDPENFISESYRILKPGGKIIIMTPSWVHNHWGPYFLDYTHVTPFTAPSLSDFLELNNFSNIHVEHFYQLPVIWKLKFMKIICSFIRMTPLPYSPMHKVSWPNFINKFIKYSNEVMLLAYAEKR